MNQQTDIRYLTGMVDGLKKATDIVEDHYYLGEALEEAEAQLRSAIAEAYLSGDLDSVPRDQWHLIKQEMPVKLIWLDQQGRLHTIESNQLARGPAYYQGPNGTTAHADIREAFRQPLAQKEAEDRQVKHDAMAEEVRRITQDTPPDVLQDMNQRLQEIRANEGPDPRGPLYTPAG